MTDIFDIKTILFGFIFSVHYLAIIGSIIFFAVFYLILEKFFSPIVPKEIQEKKVEENMESIKEILYKKIRFIENNLQIYSKEEFYNDIFGNIKEILFYIYNDKNIYKMTLEEIKEIYHPSFFELIKEIYIKKFSEEFDDNNEKREEIIKKIKEVLKINF